MAGPHSFFCISLWLWIGFSTVLSSCAKDPEPEAMVPCLERAVFNPPKESPYILPFPVGEAYILSQSYCNPAGGHRNQLAYDFALPIGAEVVAARSGLVLEVSEGLPDTGSGADPGAHNHVFILHEDGTVAFYAHLKQAGVVVQAGESIEEGQLIGQSGNSGNTGGFPHLHFGAYQAWPAREGYDVAVNFRNAAGLLDERGGLSAGERYEAMPY